MKFANMAVVLALGLTAPNAGNYVDAFSVTEPVFVTSSRVKASSREVFVLSMVNYLESLSPLVTSPVAENKNGGSYLESLSVPPAAEDKNGKTYLESLSSSSVVEISTELPTDYLSSLSSLLPADDVVISQGEKDEDPTSIDGLAADVTDILEEETVVEDTPDAVLEGDDTIVDSAEAREESSESELETIAQEEPSASGSEVEPEPEKSEQNPEYESNAVPNTSVSSLAMKVDPAKTIDELLAFSDSALVNVAAGAAVDTAKGTFTAALYTLKTVVDAVTNDDVVDSTSAAFQKSGRALKSIPTVAANLKTSSQESENLFEGMKAVTSDDSVKEIVNLTGDSITEVGKAGVGIFTSVKENASLQQISFSAQTAFQNILTLSNVAFVLTTRRFKDLTENTDES